MKYIKTPLPIGTHLWKTEDFFALCAEPEDRVEFALHHLQSGKYLQYGSVFSSTSDGALTAESFNVVVDQTVADSSQSSGYTAQTRSVCQRFTFEKKDVEGDVYYHILPLLRVDEEVKCVYRSEYRLVSENGTVKVKEMTVSGVAVEDPTSGRWRLQQTAGGKYLIKNVSTGTYLNMENNAVCLTQQQPRSTLWELKAISLAMEKDYQQYTNTCGLASARMILKYLRGTDTTDLEWLQSCHNVTNKVYDFTIAKIAQTMNAYLGTGPMYSVTGSSKSLMDFQELISNSINQFYPLIVNNKPLEYIAQAEAFGYCYSQNAGGHYYVVKGLYYSDLNGYQAVINETHYKFGEVPLGRYDRETDSIESLDRERITNNIGGRDVVVDYSMLHTVYSQSNHGVMYMNKTGGNS